MDSSGTKPGGRARARWSAVALTAGAASASALGTGVASADENYGGDATFGPSFALVRTGQIEDPMENVLERLTLLAETTSGMGTALHPNG